MIRVDLSWGVTIYLIFSTVGILVVWGLFGRDKVFRGYVKTDKFIWECSICTHTYVDSKESIYSKCPRCASINKRDKDFRVEIT